MKIKNISKVLIVFLIAMVIVIPKISLADSGFDYTYGGSYSSSDYGGYSSWGSDYSSHDYSYSYGGGTSASNTSPEFELGMLLVFMLFVGGMIMLTILMGKPNNGINIYTASSDTKYIDNHIDAEVINNVLAAIKEKNSKYTKEYIVSLIGDAYKKLQKAYTKRDLTTLRSITSDNFYTFLEGRIDEFNKNNNYQVIDDITVENVKIKRVNLIDNIAIFDVSLTSIEKNYYVDGESKITEGTLKPMFIVYSLGIDLNIDDESIIFNTKEVDYNINNEFRNTSIPIDFDEILKLDPTLTKDNIINEVYKTYESLQYAWSNFDYEEMRKLVSDELYNSYKYQLDTLKLKKEQNIMKDIEFISGKINNIEVHNNILSMIVIINVEQVDYIVNEKGKITQGDEITHSCSYELYVEKGVNKVVKNCPNCGAEVIDSASKTCASCGANLIDSTNRFIIIKKKIIKQR